MKEIKTVILCGGKGLRFKPFSNNIPKPMALIGKYPILVHIMKFYSSFGINKFILCLGYLGNKIIKYFSENKKLIEKYKWNIEFIDTGKDTETGSRIKKIERYIDTNNFFVTYGDGVSDLNLHDLFRYHINRDKIGTITLVKPRSNFGIVKLDQNCVITSFIEKPILKDWINGGFFVFKKDVLKYMQEEKCILEKDTFPKLAQIRELNGFKHNGFWACMDTYKDYIYLTEIYRKNNGFNNVARTKKIRARM